MAMQFFSGMDLSTVNILQDLNGKTIYDTKTGKTYKMITQFIDNEQHRSQYVNSGNLKTKMMDHWYYAGGEGTPLNNNLYVDARFKAISFQLMEINPKITTLTLSKNIIKNTEAPYYIMAFPYYDGDILIREGSSTNVTVKSTKDLALNLATSISKELGSLSFDIQIVPYFYYNDRLDISIDQKPIIDITNLNIALDGGDSGPYYPLKTQVVYYPLTEQKKNSILFFLDKSSFSFSQIKNNIKGAKHYTDIYTKKQDVQTLKYRFCSPSFNSIFEFNPALNDGYNGFSVYATLKPYSPYFRIVPQFNGLYGKNFNGEQRGLVMTGDFSITQVTDAYTNYVNSNKNFQNIFDRSIENLEFTNEQELEKQRWNIGTAWLSGIGSSLSALPYAGAAGTIGAGISTAVGSTVGAVMDYNRTQDLMNETLDYKNDLFNYNIGNIKAQPYTLGKLSGYSVDNKYFPVLEIYDCTDTEKEAFKNKVTYNGMSINRIGKLIDFLDSSDLHYYKAKLIRTPDTEEDTGYWASLVNEVNSGFYYKEV